MSLNMCVWKLKDVVMLPPVEHGDSQKYKIIIDMIRFRELFLKKEKKKSFEHAWLTGILFLINFLTNPLMSLSAL